MEDIKICELLILKTGCIYGAFSRLLGRPNRLLLSEREATAEWLFVSCLNKVWVSSKHEMETLITMCMLLCADMHGNKPKPKNDQSMLQKIAHKKNIQSLNLSENIDT